MEKVVKSTIKKVNHIRKKYITILKQRDRFEK